MTDDERDRAPASSRGGPESRPRRSLSAETLPDGPFAKRRSAPPERAKPEVAPSSDEPEGDR